jgi:small-conductance mechanosensitive channel
MQQQQMEERRGQNVHLEYERHRSRCLYRMLAEKVLLITGGVVLLLGVVILCLDTSPIQTRLLNVFDFMMSYINFSQKVLRDMFSFIVGLLFVGVFTLATISITLLCFVLFLAIIFVFLKI